MENPEALSKKRRDHKNQTMKKNLKTPLLMAAVPLILLGSCKKEEPAGTTAGKQAKSNLVSSSVPLTYYNFGTEILEEDFIKSPENDLEEQYNRVEYGLTLGLLELYNHPDLLAALVSKTYQSPNKCYDMFIFASEHPEVNDIFNQVFATRFDDFSSYDNSWKRYVEANYKYDINYIPFARFANRGGIDLARETFIAAPFEISEEKFPDFDDNIPLWVKGDNGVQFSTLNYTTAKVLVNPTLLISNGVLGDGNVVFEPAPEDPPPAQTMSCYLPSHVHEYLTHTKFRIDHRYEGTGKSEYKFIWGATTTYKPADGDWYSYQKISANGTKVHKNDIGTDINYYFDTYSPTWFPTNYCFEINMMGLAIYKHYAVGAMELDWYAGMKDVFTIRNQYNTGDITYKDRRKFSNEWYFLDPATNISYPFNVRNPAQHTTYHNYNKGHLQLHRWNL
jgi:hypothetical protein